LKKFISRKKKRRIFLHQKQSENKSNRKKKPLGTGLLFSKFALFDEPDLLSEKGSERRDTSADFVQK